MAGLSNGIQDQGAESYRDWFLEIQERHRRIGPPFKAVSEAELLKSEINRLLEWLYDPTPSYVGWQCGERAATLGLTGESINLGDLHVVEVKPLADGTYLVTVEEAAPDATNLQLWLQARLDDWGWIVQVQTEW